MLFLSLCPPDYYNDPNHFPLLSLCPTPLSPLFLQLVLFSDSLPAICFMLWLVHIRTHIYEVPYSPFERFLFMNRLCLFFISYRPVESRPSGLGRHLSGSLLVLYQHTASPTPGSLLLRISQGWFFVLFLFDTSLPTIWTSSPDCRISPLR